MFTICNGCQASQLATDRQRKSKEALVRERERERGCVWRREVQSETEFVWESEHTHWVKTNSIANWIFIECWRRRRRRLRWPTQNPRLKTKTGKREKEREIEREKGRNRELTRRLVVDLSSYLFIFYFFRTHTNTKPFFSVGALQEIQFSESKISVASRLAQL